MIHDCAGGGIEAREEVWRCGFNNARPYLSYRWYRIGAAVLYRIVKQIASVRVGGDVQFGWPVVVLYGLVGVVSSCFAQTFEIRVIRTVNCTYPPAQG